MQEWGGQTDASGDLWEFPGICVRMDEMKGGRKAVEDLRNFIMRCAGKY